MGGVERGEVRRPVLDSVAKRAGWGCGLSLMAMVCLLVALTQVATPSCDVDLSGLGAGAHLPGGGRSGCAGSKRKLISGTMESGGDAVKERLAAGDKVNNADNRGYRALPCAALAGNREAVQALLDAGADPTREGTGGGRPIVAAVSGNGLFDDPSDSG